MKHSLPVWPEPMVLKWFDREAPESARPCAGYTRPLRLPVLKIVPTKQLRLKIISWFRGLSSGFLKPSGITLSKTHFGPRKNKSRCRLTPGIAETKQTRLAIDTNQLSSLVRRLSRWFSKEGKRVHRFGCNEQRKNNAQRRDARHDMVSESVLKHSKVFSRLSRRFSKGGGA